ncbi:hypothetical protein V7S57_18580 [Caulobacter sp. CCNWLY153]|uniref:hypothetical protein n=1 Tax=unclassified Caulobacter TaxID=2648921 RepID=UPI002FF29C96
MFQNVERVDRAEVQSLIDAWLKAELEEDAYLREAPEDVIYAGVVLKREPAWKPDSILRRVTFEELAAADIDPFEEIGQNEYVVRDVSDRDLRFAGRKKVFSGAPQRVDDEDEEVAEEHVKALFTRLGIPIDEFSAKFETAGLMMMRAHDDLWRAMGERDAARYRL